MNEQQNEGASAHHHGGIQVHPASDHLGRSLHADDQIPAVHISLKQGGAHSRNTYSMTGEPVGAAKSHYGDGQHHQSSHLERSYGGEH